MAASTSRKLPAPAEDIARAIAFVNTLSRRGTAAPKEALPSYRALLDWARAVGIVPAAAAVDLARRAEQHPRDADESLARARDLREALHGVFSAVAAGQKPSPSVLATLTGLLAPGLAHARLVYDSGALRWAPGPVAALDDVTREVARAAAYLVGSESLARVRACAAEDCRWWFIDDTRNHSRRWCEMKTCGNRAKLRRYRARA